MNLDCSRITCVDRVQAESRTFGLIISSGSWASADPSCRTGSYTGAPRGRVVVAGCGAADCGKGAGAFEEKARASANYHHSGRLSGPSGENCKPMLARCYTAMVA